MIHQPPTIYVNASEDERKTANEKTSSEKSLFANLPCEKHTFFIGNSVA